MEGWYLYFVCSCGLLVVAGTVCQVAVVMAIKRNRHLRNGPFSLISNLTYVQLVKDWLSMPTFAVSFVIPSNDILCKLSIYSWLVTDHAAFVILTAISLDRYINIVYPFKAATIAASFRKRVPFVAWCLALVLSLPVLFAYGTKEVETGHTNHLKSNETTYTCISDMGDLGKAVFLTSVCTGLLGPSLISTFCYVRIGHVIWTRRKKFPSSFSNQQKSKLKIVKMALTVLLLGDLTWSPFALGVVFETFNIVKIFGEVHMIYMSVATNLLFFGGIIIPFVYALFSPEFRESFNEILCFKLYTQRSRLQFKQKVNNVQLQTV